MVDIFSYLYFPPDSLKEEVNDVVSSVSEAINKVL